MGRSPRVELVGNSSRPERSADRAGRHAAAPANEWHSEKWPRRVRIPGVWLSYGSNTSSGLPPCAGASAK